MERPGKYDRIVDGKLAPDDVSVALITLHRFQLIAIFKRWTLPRAYLVGMHYKRVAVPETDGLPMPSRKAEFFAYVAGVFGMNPAYAMHDIVFA